MKRFDRFLKILVAASLLASVAFVPTTRALARSSDDAGARRIVGYFIEWGIYARNYTAKNVATSGSASKLSVINYAFSNVAPDASGQVVCKLGDEWADMQRPWAASESVDGTEVTWPNPVLGNFQQLRALKALYPNVKVVISLGGWTWSRYFSDAALTPASRAAFVQSCVDLFIRGNLPDPGWGGMGGPGSGAGVFDGIDIDWEYPASEGNAGNIIRPEDTQNFTALLAEFRSQLNAVRPGLLLTFASPAAASKYSKIELANVSQYVDWINLLTYDFHGTWDMSTNFQANLFVSPRDPSAPGFSVDDTVRGYLSAGVPSSKIVIGVPFYGRGWAGVPGTNHGLFQTSTGAAGGTWEAGVDDFKVLKDRMSTGGFVRYWDGRSKSAWLFNGNTFWTFDDEEVMSRKTDYIRIQNLGGAMFWELSGDNSNGSLIDALFQGLNGCAKAACQ